MGVTVSMLRRLAERARGLTAQATGSYESSATADLAVVDQLRDMGVDLEQPVVVRSFLDFPDEDAATEAADVLDGRGFEVLIGRPGDSAVPSRTMIASRPMVVDVESTATRERELAELAAQVG